MTSGAGYGMLGEVSCPDDDPPTKREEFAQRWPEVRDAAGAMETEHGAGLPAGTN